VTVSLPVHITLLQELLDISLEAGDVPRMLVKNQATQYRILRSIFFTVL
jgi:hypothetical protein